MALTTAETLAGRIWITRPNCSFSANNAQVLLIGAACISSIIALAFTWVGAWPVVPFAGVEIALLWWALRRCEEHKNDFEQITLEARRLIVETRNGKCLVSHEFDPYWAQLQLATPANQRNPRLLICSHGKAIEVGSLLTETQKMALAKELKKELGSR